MDTPWPIGRRARLHAVLLLVPGLAVCDPKSNHPGTRPCTRHAVDQPSLNGSRRNPEMSCNGRLAHPSARTDLSFGPGYLFRFRPGQISFATILYPLLQIPMTQLNEGTVGRPPVRPTGQRSLPGLAHRSGCRSHCDTIKAIPAWGKSFSRKKTVAPLPSPQLKNLRSGIGRDFNRPRSSMVYLTNCGIKSPMICTFVGSDSNDYRLTSP